METIVLSHEGTSKLRRSLPFIGATAFSLFLAIAVWGIDAYITMHNAQALLRGSDPNFGVSGLFGTTSPAHLLLVAAFQLLLPPTTAQLLLCVLALVVYLNGVVAIALQAQIGGWRILAVVGGATLGGWAVMHFSMGSRPAGRWPPWRGSSFWRNTRHRAFWLSCAVCCHSSGQSWGYCPRAS